jgi:hypothetical protein
MEVLKKLQAMFAHQGLFHNIPSEAARSSTSLIYTAYPSGKSDEPGLLLRLLSELEFSCFGTRRATPSIFGFGCVSRGTIFSVRLKSSDIVLMIDWRLEVQ